MLSWEYPPHIVGGLGRHVADLLPSLAAQGVENAYRMVKEEYGWDRIARRTIEIYKRVVEEREASDW